MLRWRRDISGKLILQEQVGHIWHDVPVLDQPQWAGGGGSGGGGAAPPPGVVSGSHFTDPALRKTSDGRFWHDVNTTLPEPLKLVLIMGDSGYSAPYTRFVMTAYHVPDRERLHWRDVSGDAVGDLGLEPRYWTEMIPLPEL